MDSILDDFTTVRVHIDDFFIFSCTLQDHMDHLLATFSPFGGSQLEDKDLRVNFTNRGPLLSFILRLIKQGNWILKKSPLLRQHHFRRVQRSFAASSAPQNTIVTSYIYSPTSLRLFIRHPLAYGAPSGQNRCLPPSPSSKRSIT